MTWFYCQDTSLADQNTLPGFRPTRLEPTHPLSDKLTPAERQPLLPSINKIKAVLSNGLNGIDLVRVWISWRVIPLSRRPGLMCTPDERMTLRGTAAMIFQKTLQRR